MLLSFPLLKPLRNMSGMQAATPSWFWEECTEALFHLHQADSLREEPKAGHCTLWSWLNDNWDFPIMWKYPTKPQLLWNRLINCKSLILNTSAPLMKSMLFLTTGDSFRKKPRSVLGHSGCTVKCSKMTYWPGKWGPFHVLESFEKLPRPQSLLGRNQNSDDLVYLIWTVSI